MRPLNLKRRLYTKHKWWCKKSISNTKWPWGLHLMIRRARREGGSNQLRKRRKKDSLCMKLPSKRNMCLNIIQEISNHRETPPDIDQQAPWATSIIFNRISIHREWRWVWPLITLGEAKPWILCALRCPISNRNLYSRILEWWRTEC